MPSDVLRAAMKGYIETVEAAERPTLTKELSMKLIHNPLKAAGMALTNLAAFALMAAPSSADERLFKALDENGDGILSETDSAIGEEVIYALDEDNSKSITLEEFRLRVSFGEMLAIDPLHGKPEPEDWYDWDPAKQEAYVDRLPKYDPLEKILVTVDLSQIGKVNIIKEPMPDYEPGTPPLFDKIIVTLIPPEEAKNR